MAEALPEDFWERWRAYVVPLTIVLAWMAAVLILGYVGYARDGGTTEQPQSGLDNLYSALQLFVLHGDAPKNPTWPYQVARFLAPAGELCAIVLGLFLLNIALRSDEMRRWMLNLSSGHAVICGIGQKGMQLARDFRGQRPAVVVIEKDPHNPMISNCYQLGMLVVIGDATKPEILAKAHLEKAGHLIATCGDDAANMEVVVRAARMLKGRSASGGALNCYAHIADRELRDFFQRKESSLGDAGRLSVETFNVSESSARLLFRHRFLDYGKPIVREDDPRHAHLIIFGFGELGQAVALQAVQMTHFPNGELLRVTIVDTDVDRKVEKFLVHYLAFPALCKVNLVQKEAETPEVFEYVKASCTDASAIVTCAVCFDDDSTSVSLGLRLLATVKQQALRCRIFARTTSDVGVSQLVRDGESGAAASAEIAGFGKIDKASSKKVVVDDELNVQARAIHKAFAELRKSEGRPATDPSVQDWEKLDPDFRESNWMQAEHMRFKVRAMGCRIASEGQCKSAGALEIPEAEIEKLAKIEHRRWMAERMLRGWVQGPSEKPKDKERRIHPDLRPWEELSRDVQKYDEDAVRQIPGLLKISRQVICADGADEG